MSELIVQYHRVMGGWSAQVVGHRWLRVEAGFVMAARASLALEVRKAFGRPVDIQAEDVAMVRNEQGDATAITERWRFPEGTELPENLRATPTEPAECGKENA